MDSVSLSILISFKINCPCLDGVSLYYVFLKMFLSLMKGMISLFIFSPTSSQQESLQTTDGFLGFSTNTLSVSVSIWIHLSAHNQ